MREKKTSGSWIFRIRSQRTYVSEYMEDLLRLNRGKDQEIKVVTFVSNKANVIKTPSTKLDIKLKNGQYLTITANIHVVPDITGIMERKAVRFDRNIQHIFNSVDLADTIPSSNEYSSVDLLIGNDFYLDIVLSPRIEIQSGLHLLSSKLGWTILTGRIKETDSKTNYYNMLVLTYGADYGSPNLFTPADVVTPKKQTLKIQKIKFKDNLRYEDGRYQVTWPWKEDMPDLPVNRGLAYGRLKSNVDRMKRRPNNHATI